MTTFEDSEIARMTQELADLAAAKLTCDSTLVTYLTQQETVVTTQKERMEFRKAQIEASLARLANFSAEQATINAEIEANAALCQHFGSTKWSLGGLTTEERAQFYALYALCQTDVEKCALICTYCNNLAQ